MSKEDMVSQIVFRYGEKTHDTKFLDGYEVWTETTKISNFVSIEYAVSHGLITYGKKLYLMVPSDTNTTTL
jgi:hypothetical protein